MAEFNEPYHEKTEFVRVDILSGESVSQVFEMVKRKTAKSDPVLDIEMDGIISYKAPPWRRDWTYTVREHKLGDVGKKLNSDYGGGEVQEFFTTDAEIIETWEDIKDALGF